MFGQTDTIQARIEALDLEPIKFKLVKEHGFSNEKVNAIEKWYRRFLYISFKHRDQSIVVSEAIDDFWHQHILDTRKYADDCQNIFGALLHHFPYFGLRGEADQQALRAAYKNTLELMRAEYGETPEDDLQASGDGLDHSGVASSCSDCGGGEGLSFGERPRLTA